MKKNKNYSIGGQRSELDGKLSCRMTALNRCTVTDSLWNRYADCRSSWIFEEILRPGSQRKSTADSLIGPSVSTEIGLNENEAGRSEFLTSFLEAAALAAAAAVMEEVGT